jgi:uncharacterized protein YueI
MSKETLEYHHDKHHQTYVNKLNELIVDTKYESMSLEEIIKNSDGAIFNNAAQVYNHDLFFMELKKEDTKLSPIEEAKKLIISRKANLDSAKEYIKLARENGLSFKKVGSPEFKGEIALVVVSDHAVNIEDIKVIAKEDKFKELGLSVKLLNKVGSEICGKCYEDISKKAPEELINFKKRSWIDKLFNSFKPIILLISQEQFNITNLIFVYILNLVILLFSQDNVLRFFSWVKSGSDVNLLS